MYLSVLVCIHKLYFSDMQTDLKMLSHWLDEVEHKLFSLTVHSNAKDDEVLLNLQRHQVNQWS